MKRVFFEILALMILISSCKKDNEENANGFIIPEGTYSGTFQRQVSGIGRISNVTLTFERNGWTGQSQYGTYPALCPRGTYKMDSTGQITFESFCVWTADFDWTLILAGEWKLIVNNNNIEFSKEYTSSLKDIYKLTKQ